MNKKFRVKDEVPAGRRHKELVRFVGYCTHHEIPKDETIRWGINYNETCFTPPFNEDELIRFIEEKYFLYKDNPIKPH